LAKTSTLKRKGITLARNVTTQRKIITTSAAWTIGLIIFFPIYWTILTSFKTEAQAINDPPLFFAFNWTLENYAIVQERSDYMKFLWNSVVVAGGSTILGTLIAIPAAWSMAFVPSVRTKDILLWMLSTKMLPAVGVLYPISLVFVQFNLLDTRGGLVVVLMLINLPIIVWMLYSYFKEIPNEILEAARMDGATLKEEILYVLTPMAIPGIASTLLLNFILAWNEAFWTLNLTAANAAPLTAFIASYSSPEGLFFAKLSAASTMAIAPILILGWFSQKQLVRGLTFGAVK
jgi:sorbitol/mannitol transport system permease protein